LAALDPAAPRRAYGVRAFADTIGMREVDFGVAPGDPFFNVNSPEDLEAASAIVDAAAGTTGSL
ncbi:MAG: hypothetical protein ACRYG8_30180, partial [Janthinobacterium lividum]